MSLNLEEIIQNENIKSDRFAMAAISYICKAFGDTIRSKEYWPWGDKVDFPWNSKNQNIPSEILQHEIQYTWPTSGELSDLTRAMICIQQAQERREKEINSNEETPNIDVSIKGLKRRLNEAIFKTDTADNVSKKINDTSMNVKNKMVEFEYYE